MDTERKRFVGNKPDYGSRGQLEPPPPPPTPMLTKVHYGPEIIQSQQQAKRILLHVGLVVLLCAYVVVGAALFFFVEHENETDRRTLGLENIREKKSNIAETLWELQRKLPLADNISSNSIFFAFVNTALVSTVGDFANEANSTSISNERDIERLWKLYIHCQLDSFMSVLFQAYNSSFVTEKDVLNTNSTEPVWTFTSALFFSATVITTIGYGHLAPQTRLGRILCILFGLVGIPLLLVTVADMGKFLSVYVIAFYRKSVKSHRWLKRKLLHCYRRKHKVTTNGTVVGGMATDTYDQYDDDDADMNSFEKGLDGSTIPVSFILAILLGYTAFGACLLQHLEEWTFLDGFGDIVPKNKNFILLTLLYIVTGIIIATMCIDLVGTEYIRKIHFFGKEIRRARSAIAVLGTKVVHMSDIFRSIVRLQRKYGLTIEQLEKMGDLPDDCLLDCLLNDGPLPSSITSRRLAPYTPCDLQQIFWIDDPRMRSFSGSQRHLAIPEDFETRSI